MNIGLIGLIVVFAAFILLLIINPRLSCFGKRITSPLYPLMRKRRLSNRPGRKAPGSAPGAPSAPGEPQKPGTRTEDYGFHLDEGAEGAGPKPAQAPGKAKKPGAKAEDYGFQLDSEDKNKKK